MSSRIATALGVALLVVTPAAAASGSSPEVTAVKQQRGHVLVTFALGDLATAGEARVSSRPARGADGALLRPYVKLSEAIRTQADPATGLIHWRSRGVLRPGLYYVQVSGVESGVTSCIPVRATCGMTWSKVSRLRIPRPPVHQVPVGTN
jgi:hypothetical protein